MYACVRECALSRFLRVQSRIWEFLELRVLVVVRWPMCMLGTKFWFSVRTVYALNY